MRVISGTARGTHLLPPEDHKIRPTSDFIKETLFNILQNDVVDSDFLDIFAGSGGIAIEALSRGAKSAVMVESSVISANLIRRNLEKTKLTKNAEVFVCDYKRAISELAGRKFSIIFLDPPYDQLLTESTLNCIMTEDLLADGGIIIAETARGAAPDNDFAIQLGLEIYRKKEYTATELIFLQRIGA